MHYDDMINIALTNGKLSYSKQKRCNDNGGHKLNLKTTINGKPAVKCKCGYSRIIKNNSVKK